VPWKILIPLALPVILVSFFILFYIRNPHARKDAVVLTDFTNSTNDPTLSASLKQALALDLERPGFPRILSDSEISESLRLMGRSSGIPMTEDVARDVCRRTGSQAVLAGSISKPNGQYLVHLKASGCGIRDVVAEAEAQASGEEGALDALHVAASDLRAKLVESR
jgi:eukaryotic-like serine/threonine-protein kinase